MENKFIDDLYPGRIRITDNCPSLRSGRSGVKVLKQINQYEGVIELNENEEYEYKIRKLTEKECFRLMGFSDVDFEKAAFDKRDLISEGKLLRNAKLKDVIEKQSQNDTEIYVLNITKGLQELGITSTEWMKYLQKPEKENSRNVNIAIEKLGGLEHSECAINITKCLESTEILYGLMKEINQHHTVIIELERRDKPNTARYMRITSEDHLAEMNVFTILMVLKLITDLKIYTSMLRKVNIHMLMQNLENCKNNMVRMQISNLKMEGIFTRVSPSQLYKQAGNSIVVDVLYYIYKQLYKAMPYLFDDLKVGSYFSGIGAFETGLDRLYAEI